MCCHADAKMLLDDLSCCYAVAKMLLEDLSFNSIQFKFICIALFTIPLLQSALQEIKLLQYIYTL